MPDNHPADDLMRQREADANVLKLLARAHADRFVRDPSQCMGTVDPRPMARAATCVVTASPISNCG